MDNILKPVKFTCAKCSKVIPMGEEIYKKAYEGHDTCLSCRTTVKPDKAVTEEELKSLISKLIYDIKSDEGLERFKRVIDSLRSLNAHNAKLVHENDELMAENALLKQENEQVIKYGKLLENLLGIHYPEALEELNHE